MNTKALLPVSVALNLLLAGKLFLTPSHSVKTASDSVTFKNSVEVSEGTEQGTARATPEIASALHWGAIESTNYYTYVENLRAIGCPELTIREILSADLSSTLRQGVAEKGASSGALGGGDAVYRDSLVNHFMNPASVSAPLRDQAASASALPAQGDSSGAGAGADDGPAIAGGNRAGAGEAERKRKRAEALQRMWFVDAVRARYGIETLLEWQFQSVRKGISFEEYVRRHTETIPR